MGNWGRTKPRLNIMKAYLTEMQRIRAVSRFLGFREGVTLGISERQDFSWEWGSGFGYGYGYGYGGDQGQGYGYGHGDVYGRDQGNGDGLGHGLAHGRTNGDGYTPS